MQEHDYSVDVDRAARGGVGALLVPRPRPAAGARSGRIDILHPGDEIGEGLSGTALPGAEGSSCSGGVGKSWEWLTEVKPYESWRYDAIGKPLVVDGGRPHPARGSRRRPHPRALHRDATRRSTRGCAASGSSARCTTDLARQRHDPRRDRGRRALAPQAQGTARGGRVAGNLSAVPAVERACAPGERPWPPARSRSRTGLTASLPAGAVTPRPTGGTDVVLRVFTGGGLVPEAVRLGEVPELTVYGDGRMIVVGPTTLEYSGPRAPQPA